MPPPLLLLLLLLLVLTVASIGGPYAAAAAAADAAERCADQRQYLVSTGYPGVVAYAWPEEEVQLHCRLPSADHCRWLRGSKTIGTNCTLRTASKGTITCMEGDEQRGRIELKRPQSQNVRKDGYHGHYNRYYAYHGETNWNHKSATFLCYHSGSLVLSKRRCDGTKNCRSGEDEEDCSLPCGAPSVPAHSRLVGPARDGFAHGATVTFSCQHGFSFGTTLSGLNRTCQNGRWDGAPPVCRQNAALGRPVAVHGGGGGGGGGGLAAVTDGLVDTWGLLPPSVGRRTLVVPLAAGRSADIVLVRLLGRGFSVQLAGRDAPLASNDTADTADTADSAGGAEHEDVVECPCQAAAGAATHPPLSREFVCRCGRAPAGRHVSVRLTGPTAAFQTLSVAELAALRTQPPTPTDPAAAAAAAAADACQRLDSPAHGWYESAGAGTVRLRCPPGHRTTCHTPLSCAALSSGAARAAACVPARCPPPPDIPHTNFHTVNVTAAPATTADGDGDAADEAVTSVPSVSATEAAEAATEEAVDAVEAVEYRCQPGYELFPPSQRRRAVCTPDGLWSLSHLSCLPESDVRVVAGRLAAQHRRAVDELRGELGTLRGELGALLSGHMVPLQRRLAAVEGQMTLLTAATEGELQLEQRELEQIYLRQERLEQEQEQEQELEQQQQQQQQEQHQEQLESQLELDQLEKRELEEQQQELEELEQLE